ncbi:MAG: peptidoglycan editing factor PgeF [Eubacterium sp.]|nr:peptidoglycan editing factor PgeF [Eubacterium sp.]
MNLIRKENHAGLNLVEHPLNTGEVLPLLHFENIEQTGMVKHCFTTRMGGVSKEHCASLNLSFTRGDDEAAVRENYRRLAEVLDAEVNQFVFTDQTHTTNVRVVTEADAGKGIIVPKDYTDVDGLITNVPGLVLSTFFADCVPLYFVDPVHRAIGMSHSGWRGTVGRMGATTLEAMHVTYGTNPADVICAIGPSICQDCYEVSADVAEAFAAEFPEHIEEILEPKPLEKFQLDLWRANEIVLLEAGVLPEHIAVTNVCTCCNPGKLFSHRASHGKRGNLGAFLSIR